MSEHVCPVWVGHLLASPVRRLFQSPEKILEPHVAPGMTALDVGPAMGFFSIPLAKMVGPAGRVVCVDVQAAMLEKLKARAAKAGVADRIDARLSADGSFGISDLEGRVDFALAFAVVHEMPNAGVFFAAAFGALKPGAKLLVAEPMNHVSAEAFEATRGAALAAGFAALSPPHIGRSRSLLIGKRSPQRGG
jgi:2-polyprenyl-3-methyl-5-hydroxy-6-metoxy-1,4-benzoquinol methylase